MKFGRPESFKLLFKASITGLQLGELFLLCLNPGGRQDKAKSELYTFDK